MPAPDDVLAALEREASRTLSLWRRLTGPQLLASSFLFLIVLATVLLLTLPGLYVTGERISLLDALFMATASVCITGLAVVDVATEFTLFGQAVYLILIQIGGIGILTITTVIIVWLGGRVTLRSEAALGAAEAGPAIDTSRLFGDILRYALGIEALGAFALWIAWSGELGAVGAIWPAVFHAVSAFCNAGVSNLEGGLAPYGDNPFLLIVIMILVILGGIGFLVLEEVLGVWRRIRQTLSLHSRLVLLSTAILIGGGAILFGLLEWGLAFQSLPWYDRAVQALFLSVVPRTAGFAVVDYNDVSAASLFLTMILMMIGGSPGSTAGGLKTTTIAVLVALAVTRVRGETVTHAFRHTIPEVTIQRAVGLVIIAIAFLSAAILVLQVIELGGVPQRDSDGAFLALTFEAVGAFNTAGISLGITPALSSAGKLVLVLLMYVGRVGPLTFAASMLVAARKPRARIRYSTEDVIIG